MPPASGAGGAPQPSSPPDPVLAAERDHLRRSREFLRLMRENVLGLRAMAGDRVSEGYLKADLYRRAPALRDIPGAPLFSGRLDYADDIVMDQGVRRGNGRPAGRGGGRRRRQRRGRPGRPGAGRAAAHRPSRSLRQDPGSLTVTPVTPAALPGLLATARAHALARPLTRGRCPG
jgi:hypothetical protein